MKKIFILISILAIAVSLTAQPRIKWDIKSYKKNLRYLASDETRGRKPGTAGDSLSSKFIADFFLKLGMKKLDNSYYQPFNVLEDVDFSSENSLYIDNKPRELLVDYVPDLLSADGNADGNIVFAGYGYTSSIDTVRWDDYKNIDVKNKWILIFKGEPDKDSMGKPIEAVFTLKEKIALAQKNGAVGILCLNPFREEKISKPLINRSLESSVEFKIPVINIDKKTASLFFKEFGQTTESVFETVRKGKKTNITLFKQTVKANIKVDRKYIKTHNVLAIIEGSDPILKNEYILLGAHYDHLGMGGKGSGSRAINKNEIHNGADDNASGVAGIMQIADQLIKSNIKTKRSLIFIAFSAEEWGLLGSKYYVKQSIVPIKSIKTMLNYDMIGRLDNKSRKLSITGTGTAVEFNDLLKKYNDTTLLKLELSSGGYGGSDHTSFFQVGIPVLFFNSGIHSEYHTPDDDENLINYGGAEQILDLSYKLLYDVANRDSALKFNEMKSNRTQTSMRSLKVTLGIMPGITATNVEGLKVEGVTQNAPAEKAGIKKDDVIFSIQDVIIRNIYEYMEQLNKIQPGSKIKVGVVRQNQKKIIDVQL